MIKVWRSEIRKLIRPRFLVSNFLIALSLQIAFTATVFLNAKGALVTDLSKSTGLFYSTQGISLFLGIILFCIFAASFAQEFSYGTLKNLLIFQPSRTKLILGKFLALTTLAALLLLIIALIGGALSYLLSGSARVSTNNWDFISLNFMSPLANVFLASIGYGVLGALLAILFRSSVISISAGLIWFLVIETLFLFLGKSIAKWLPGYNLVNLASGGTADLSYSHSLSLIMIFSIVGMGILLIIFRLRDVAN